MTTEEVNIRENVELFVDMLQNAFVDKIVLSLDLQPTFDKAAVPFQFEYSFSILMVTNKGNFKIISAATSDGTEAFWIEQIEEIVEGNRVIEISSNVRSIELKTAEGFQYPFKMVLKFDDKELFLYCGEIYDDVDEKLKYNFNDEMVLVFDERQEALKFETLLNFG